MQSGATHPIFCVQPKNSAMPKTHESSAYSFSNGSTMTPPPAAVLFNVLFADSLVADIKYSVNESRRNGAPGGRPCCTGTIYYIILSRARISRPTVLLYFHKTDIKLSKFYTFKNLKYLVDILHICTYNHSRLLLLNFLFKIANRLIILNAEFNRTFTIFKRLV